MIQALTNARASSWLCSGPRTEQARRRRDPRRSQALRRAVQENRDRIDGVIVTLPNFGDERAIADTLRLARLERPRAGAGHARYPGQDDHPAPPRQFLRQDVGLQQSHAVRHSLLPDHAAHRSAGSPRFCEGSRLVRRRLPRGQRVAQPAHRRIGARPAAFNTVRYSEKILEAQRHLGRDARPVGSLGPHRAAEGRRRRRASQARSHPEICFDRRAFPTLR